MASAFGAMNGNVERFPMAEPSAGITQELNRILSLLREAAPTGSQISFDFDGCLHVHIDVRAREDVLMLEHMLCSLDLGMFSNITHGRTPHHPFFHRVSARVNA